MSRPVMSRAEMQAGFAAGRRLVQEEWSSPAEIEAVDALVAEGKADVVAPWAWDPNFQCERRVIVGRKAAPGVEASA